MATLRTRIEAWLQAQWYGARAPNPVLRALSGLFGWIARRRRAAFVSGRKPGARVALPLIVVGNLAVGGAGKTPLTLALVEALRARGFRPGVISRGYGRVERAACRVQPDDSASKVGDEPLLIARRSRAPVAVAARRIEAAQVLIDSGEVDVLIADDGLQHYALARDIEILVIDGKRRFGNGLVLPAGPLREPPARAQACDFIVLNAGTPQAGEIPMRLELDQAWPLLRGPARGLHEFIGQPLHAVAGIADPQRFFDALRAHGLAPQTHGFADHHAFTAADLDFGDQAPLLMTEKDAVKCSRFARANWYAVPALARLPESFFDALAARLRDLKGGLT